MESLQTRQQLIQDWYHFEFPDDFYRFWEFANRLRPLNPLGALQDDLGILMTGPFDFLYGKCDKNPPPSHPYLHWRYYLDPPEFFTVLVGTEAGIHWGYYLDHPGSSQPGFIASYYANEALELNCDGNTLFKAVRLILEEKLARDVQNQSLGLISSDGLRETERICDRIRKVLINYQTENRIETGDSYLETYQSKPRRFRTVIASTLDSVGIVVPGDKYRKPAYRNKQIERMIWRSDGQQKLALEARLMLRNGYPGTALQLAKALWTNCEASSQSMAYELLQEAYNKLDRPILAEVLEVHWKNRDRPWLDIFQDPADLV